MSERAALQLTMVHLGEVRASLGVLASLRHDAELAADTFDSLAAELDADASGVSVALRGAASCANADQPAVDTALVADAHAAALRVRDAVRRGTAARAHEGGGDLRAVLDVMDALEGECTALERRLLARLDLLKVAAASPPPARKRAHSDLEAAVNDEAAGDSSSEYTDGANSGDEDDGDDDDDDGEDDEDDEDDDTYTESKSV